LPDGFDTGTQFIERKLATILSADVAEFSRLMGEDEEQTLRTFRGHKKVFESLVATHRGRIFNTAGDAILAEFPSAVEAVRCATDIQSALRTRNDQLPPNRQVRFRIGVNLGDVMVQGQDLLGDGVNVAARLQTAAEPGGICISGSVHDQIRNKLSLSFLPLGEKNFKNIQQPVRTFSITEAEDGGILPAVQPGSAWSRSAFWFVGGLFLVVGGGYGAYAVFERGKKVDTPPATAVTVSTAPTAFSTSSSKAATKTDDNSRPSAIHAPASSTTTPIAAPPSTRPGSYEGLYSGPVCYGETKQLPARCYPSQGAIRGTKITGKWPMPHEQDVIMFLDGDISPTGDLTIQMHSDKSDGTRVTTITLVGTIRAGLLEARGKFAKGRPATLNWHLNSPAPH
jgi:class 3 adenylate cyclase